MNSEEEGSPREYAAAVVPAEVRKYMAEVAELYAKEGISYKRQLEIAKERGYVVSEPTFRRQRHKVKEGESPLSDKKNAGRPKALSAAKIMVLVGWVLHQNDENEKVGILDAQQFVLKTWGRKLGEGTVHRYFVEAAIASLKGRRRTAGYKFDLESLINLYIIDVERFWNLGIKDMRADAVCCIDSCSIGWRLLTRRTYAPKGGPQPHIRKGNPAYTNLVVWATFPDGVNRCPALLLTGDPQLLGNSRKKDRLVKLMEKYGVDDSRIVDCGDKQYVGETQATVIAFLNHYPFLKDCLIISDAGKSYAKKGVDIV